MLGVLSALLPGAGQLYLGHRRRGLVLPAWLRVPIACAVLLGLAAITVAPHAITGYYNAQAYQTVTSLFGGDGGLANQLPGRSDTKANAAPRPAAWPGRLTVLLLGGDAGAGRVGLRTDTMIMASLDPAAKRVALIGLPRNLTRVPLAATAGVEQALHPLDRAPSPQDSAVVQGRSCV
jgi:hypothetical protein